MFAQAMLSVGSENIDALAERIWKSVGPSGPNKVSQLSATRPIQSGIMMLEFPLHQEYMYSLAKAVRDLAPESHDSHLSALEVSYTPIGLGYH